ncbi:hybrid sensor histidine kinase/response regulator [Geoalkalibacter halelectricus]|uniref:histidine kinase n=1 Tax=Geoalkalibacter halelectricus TaxID=2847045 RepID=A0ABY5ZP35_9BACT|nr:hybrid sensor histidine kinase/response regulator [Geoalkalibacter halelectricus]MDO3380073.1 hybrid sensor histidine kinase/response regulator [Geoalkalibacter halelectricus]UWZ80408.1 hybrid sensor histidine kinase/response regulator [Geoalkalibacter halelectricus]
MKKNLTVLVVDDSPTQVAVLQDALEDRGYAVRTARNGVEAIGIVYQDPPHLVLSDIVMPELNGYHLCRLLKNDPATAKIPVILLTNLSEQHDRFWGQHAGADLYLEKSSPTDQIAAALEQILTRNPPVHAPAPVTTAAEHPPREVIQARVNTILDRLLYESTISNEILRLTSLAHDVPALAQELLKFLGAICRHDAAGLLLRHSREKQTLALGLNVPMPSGFALRAQEMMLAQAGLESDDGARTQLLIYPENPPLLPEPDGDLHIFHAVPIKDGDTLLALICLFNRTPRRPSEGIVQAMQWVAERFLIVARYLCKLTEIEEVKADFLSMLVHDLRSPLTSIRGFSDVLAQGMLGPLSDEQKSALHNIQGGSDRLLSLIEDILHLSKLEAGKMQIRSGPFQFADLAKATFQDLAALFLEKDLRMDFSACADLPTVMGDTQQLHRVLTNLLTNAAKFSPRGGRISIAAHLHAPGPGTTKALRVEITDEGPGIPKDQQKDLFGRYQQIRCDTPRARKGTGLGLAICKEIVHLHGGDIWVESPVDEKGGSRFCFTIPQPE